MLQQWIGPSEGVQVFWGHTCDGNMEREINRQMSNLSAVLDCGGSEGADPESEALVEPLELCLFQF